MKFVLLSGIGKTINAGPACAAPSDRAVKVPLVLTVPIWKLSHERISFNSPLTILRAPSDALSLACSIWNIRKPNMFVVTMPPRRMMNMTTVIISSGRVKAVSSQREGPARERRRISGFIASIGSAQRFHRIGDQGGVLAVFKSPDAIYPNASQ